MIHTLKRILTPLQIESLSAKNLQITDRQKIIKHKFSFCIIIEKLSFDTFLFFKHCKLGDDNFLIMDILRSS